MHLPMMRVLGRHAALLLSLVSTAVALIGCRTNCPTPYVAVRLPDTGLTISVGRVRTIPRDANHVTELRVFRNNELMDSVRVVLTNDDAVLSVDADGAGNAVVRAPLGREYRIRSTDGRIEVVTRGNAHAPSTSRAAAVLGAFDFDRSGTWRFLPANSPRK